MWGWNGPLVEKWLKGKLCPMGRSLGLMGGRLCIMGRRICIMGGRIGLMGGKLDLLGGVQDTGRTGFKYLSTKKSWKKLIVFSRGMFVKNICL